MKMFLKAQLSSLIATLVDFGITILLVEVFGLNYAAATFTGAVLGGVVNFTINKYWSFTQGSRHTKSQAMKYGLVWIGSIAFNTAGSAFATEIFNCSYVFSKAVVSIIVGITFNYSLQKYYVFSKTKRSYQE